VVSVVDSLAVMSDVQVLLVSGAEEKRSFEF